MQLLNRMESRVMTATTVRNDQCEAGACRAEDRVDCTSLIGQCNTAEVILNQAPVFRLHLRMEQDVTGRQ